MRDRAHRRALRAAAKEEARIEAGSWFHTAAGRSPSEKYAEEVWWPSLHVELTTKAAYRSILETHFLPYFGHMQMAKILPSHAQTWVNEAVEHDLTPRSVGDPLHGTGWRAGNKAGEASSA